MSIPMLSERARALLRRGVVIPASPLALDGHRNLDERHQRALYRYYAASGVGGIATAVHTTQFEIREHGIDLFEPLLEFTSETIDTINTEQNKTIIKIAGVCGKTEQACKEAEILNRFRYDIALVSLAELKTATDDELITHCKEISRIIPLMGFYLQPAVGGKILPYSFWQKFVEIPNVTAIKIAPFNRYFTLDVVKAVAFSGRENEIMLYTGNDDNIIIDLLTPYVIKTPAGEKTLRIRGGLLGQWAIWTSKAVQLLGEIYQIVEKGDTIPLDMLRKNIELTDANATIFDPSNRFAGCISGIHEVLKRQGLIRFARCLNPELGLSPGQEEEIERIYRDYPWITDDDFVREHLHEWLR